MAQLVRTFERPIASTATHSMRSIRIAVLMEIGIVGLAGKLVAGRCDERAVENEARSSHRVASFGALG